MTCELTHTSLTHARQAGRHARAAGTQNESYPRTKDTALDTHITTKCPSDTPSTLHARKSPSRGPHEVRRHTHIPKRSFVSVRCAHMHMGPSPLTAQHHPLITRHTAGASSSGARVRVRVIMHPHHLACMTPAASCSCGWRLHPQRPAPGHWRIPSKLDPWGA